MDENQNMNNGQQTYGDQQYNNGQQTYGNQQYNNCLLYTSRCV